jgi:hypothetical protein
MLTPAPSAVASPTSNGTRRRHCRDKVKGPLGVTFTPWFEIDGTLTFHPLGDDLAFFNGDLPLKADETDHFIDALIANGLIFLASSER